MIKEDKKKMDLLSQCPLFSTDQATKGFDLSAGDKWIYPENYPVREYQFNIVKSSLFHNTLVCLPTGLGKTFIAAVVMYNYWRWYPQGVIVFLAPTKPLVSQQIDACHNIMGIPLSETTELTGAINQKKREGIWRTKRVIFATPQTFQKDLEKGIVPTHLIKCIVIDEAHKALGKHAYTESVRLLNQSNQYYRLLALSATPGSKLDAVQEVIRNLGITRLELRDDTSPDITPYINDRQIEIIEVGLGDDLTRFHERYMAVMDPHIRVLVNNNILRGQPCNLSKGRIFLLRKDIMSNKRRPANYGSIMQALNILLTMCHANELMMNHGLRAFHHFYQNHSDKYWINNEHTLLELLDDVKEFIGPFPDVASIIDGTITDIPCDIKFSHGKFEKLRTILMQHFQAATNTRAIVFVEYRDIVHEVFVLLMQLKPLIRPQIFVGQAGLRQKEQKKALDLFRNNDVNVLISTSVGEEGLDVGEVDLIVCFDIQQNSSTRLVQRMGRTARKRAGRVIVLVTDGKERQNLNAAIRKRDSLNMKVLHSSGVLTALANENPRMIPEDLKPQVMRMRMTVIPTTPRARKKLKAREIKRNNDCEKEILDNAKPSTSKKCITKNGQSMMMKFLASKAPNARAYENNEDDDDDLRPMEVEEIPRTEFISYDRNKCVKIKPSDVKLLTSDNDAVEFLTLCALRQSEKELMSDVEYKDIPYMPKSSTDESDSIFDIEIPSLKILDCLSSLNEYIPPIVEDTNDINEIDEPIVWEPSDLYEDNSTNIGDSRKGNSICTDGKFEDLLDTTDSDVTTLGSQDYEANQRNSTEVNKNISKSVIVDGAFEDLLDDSDDDSVVEVSPSPPKTTAARNISSLRVKNNLNVPNYNLDHRAVDTGVSQDLLNNRIDPFTSDESNDKKCDENMIINQSESGNTTSELANNISKEKIQDIDNINFNNDFGSWESMEDVEFLESIETPRKNLVKSHGNNTNTSTPKATIDENQKETLNTQQRVITQVEQIQLCRSPDLSRSQRRVRAKSNISNDTSASLSSSRIVAESNNDIHEQIIDSDEDMFDCDSICVDSDLYPLNHDNREIINDQVDENKTVPSVDNNNSEVQSTAIAEVNIVQESNKMNEVNINYDDYDWSSDFEIATEPITETKYFGNNFDNTSVTSPGIGNFSRHSPTPGGSSEKENCNKRMAVNTPVKSVSLSKKLSKIRHAFFTNSRTTVRQDSDSDSDFGPKIITKPVFRELENNQPSDPLFINPSKNNVTTSKNNETKILPENRFQKFAAPTTKIPHQSRTSMVDNKKSWAKRSAALDEYRRRKIRKNNRNKRMKNNFIDDEATVSQDENISQSDEETGNDDDDDLGDFVSHSQFNDTNVDMRAHYLQSVRSPNRPGKFLIRKPKSPPPDMQIYSQAVPINETNAYLYDSFCVKSDEDIVEVISSDEISILEAVEKKLKSKKRKRRNSAESQRKRKRIIQLDNTSSDEDEMERMRAQIAEESMMLKNK